MDPDTNPDPLVRGQNLIDPQHCLLLFCFCFLLEMSVIATSLQISPNFRLCRFIWNVSGMGWTDRDTIKAKHASN